MPPSEANAYTVGVERYLAYVKRPSRPLGSSVPVGNWGQDVDRQWNASFPGQESQLGLVLAAAVMEAAHQHLKAVAVLAAVPDVDVALEALARPCCEASASVLWILDPGVTSAVRAERALNLAWARRVIPERLNEEALRLGIPVKINQRGDQIGFGAGMDNATDLLIKTLGSNGLKNFVGSMYSWWSSSSHGDLKAGFQTLARPDGGAGWVFRRIALAMSAWAHIQAERRYQEYCGRFDEASFLQAIDTLTVATFALQDADPPA